MPKNKNITYHYDTKIEFVEGNDQEDWYHFIINDFTQYYVGRRHYVDEDGNLIEYTYISSTLEFKKAEDTIYYWVEESLNTLWKPIDIIKIGIEDNII